MGERKLVVIAILGCLITVCQGDNRSNHVKSRSIQAAENHRPDYISHEGMYYRFFNTPETYQDAQELCRFQGSHLVVPKNEEEVKFLNSLFSHSTDRIWIGIHSQYSPHTYITVTGEHISEVYENWERNEPADIGDGKLCVLLKNGKWTVDDCGCKNKFICASKGWNGQWIRMCKGYSKDYKLSKDGTVCYKAYHEPKTWEWVLKICNADGARLPRIRNHEQATEIAALGSEVHRTLSQTRQYKTGRQYCSLGFNRLSSPNERRFMYDDGKTLKETGYESWMPNEPNYYIHRDGIEYCGVINFSGLLGDHICNTTDILLYFVCESDINT